MAATLSLPDQLARQVERILVDLRRRTGAECILLTDISGQLIDAQGHALGIDPALVAVLAAGDMAAMNQLDQQTSEQSHRGSFLHEGGKKSLYLFNVAGRFVLIAIFKTGTSLGRMRMLVSRAAEQLHPLTIDFEEPTGPPQQVSDTRFGARLAQDLDRIF